MSHDDLYEAVEQLVRAANSYSPELYVDGSIARGGSGLVVDTDDGRVVHIAFSDEVGDVLDEIKHLFPDEFEQWRNQQ